MTKILKRLNFKKLGSARLYCVPFYTDDNSASLMTKILKLIGSLLIVIVIVCGFSYLSDKANYTGWIIKNEKPERREISWAKFKWTNDSLGEKYYEKTAMYIPCKVEGLPYNFTFQFDLGAGLTEIYENSISSFFKLHPGLHKNIKRLQSPLQFWNFKKMFQDLTIKFGSMSAKTEKGCLHKSYGEKVSVSNPSDNREFHIGTIGADLFQNKILIIDYPNQRFAICDTLPNSYKVAFSNIELDVVGRVLLPMQLKGKNYKVMFDNGSSIFPFIVSDDKIIEFSTLPDTDTLRINSWGKKHDVIGRLIQDSFQLAGQAFSNVKVYADFRKEYRTKIYDAITGNSLFWEKTVIIDFKNRKFGVK
jgi:hypothetical protein